MTQFTKNPLLQPMGSFWPFFLAFRHRLNKKKPLHERFDQDSQPVSITRWIRHEAIVLGWGCAAATEQVCAVLGVAGLRSLSRRTAVIVLRNRRVSLAPIQKQGPPQIIFTDCSDCN